MATERTFSMIKPDATRRNLTGQITARLEAAGLAVVASKRIWMTRRQAEQFYAVHKERPFYGELVVQMSAGPVVVQVLEGDDAVARNREVMGATNPAQAAPGTIRKDFALSIAYGMDNNIYAAGVSGAPSSYWDFFVLSLSADGDTNWTYRHDGPGTIEDYDMALTITYGSDGNIYAGGNSKVDSVGGEFFVVSLKTNGETNWTYRYGTEFLGGAANSIVYGDDGNVYVAGHSFHIGTRRDFVVLSLSADGDTNWTYRYDGAFNKDEAASVVYGMDGNIYAAGYSA